MSESIDDVVTTLRIASWGKYRKRRFQRHMNAPKVDNEPVINDSTVYMIFHDRETLGVRVNTLWGILSYIHNSPVSVKITEEGYSGLYSYAQNITRKYVEEHNKKSMR